MDWQGQKNEWIPGSECLKQLRSFSIELAVSVSPTASYCCKMLTLKQKCEWKGRDGRKGVCFGNTAGEALFQLHSADGC